MTGNQARLQVAASVALMDLLVGAVAALALWLSKRFQPERPDVALALRGSAQILLVLLLGATVICSLPVMVP